MENLKREISSTVKKLEAHKNGGEYISAEYSHRPSISMSSNIKTLTKFPVLCYLQIIKYLDVESLLNFSSSCKKHNQIINSVMCLCSIISSNNNGTCINNWNNLAKNFDAKSLKSKYSNVTKQTEISKLSKATTNINNSSTQNTNNLVNANNINHNTGNSSNPTFFNMMGSMFSTLNNYTLGAFMNTSTLDTSSLKNPNDQFTSFFKTQNAVDLFYDKLYLWEEILDQILNQKTLISTIKENNRYMSELREQKQMKSLKTASSLSKNPLVKAKTGKSNYSITNTFLNKMEFNFNSDENHEILMLKNKYLLKQIEELQVKKDMLIKQIDISTQEVELLNEENTNNEIKLYKLNRFFKNNFKDADIKENCKDNKEKEGNSKGNKIKEDTNMDENNYEVLLMKMKIN